MEKIKVMIVDDHPVVREGLKQLCEIDEVMEVIAEARTGLECLQQLEKVSPDLIFMDIRMPGINGIESTRLVSEKYPHIKVIILTIYEDDQYVTEAIRAGAKGYVLKKVQREELLKIVHQVMENQAFLDPTVTADIFNRLKKEPQDSKGSGKVLFTRRELEILKEIAAGNTDRAIAEVLCISEHTVRSHVKSLFRKMGVSSRAKAVTQALQGRIITM
ncbi:MAG: DNA-binding response regulator [Deltaproteobacteria bacterium]|nr:MAG: DNA-binding response regulator [Deltaproteobacteria bacterium]